MRIIFCCRGAARVGVLGLSLVLSACGGGYDVPSEPTGLGSVETAAVQDESTVLPFVDYASTNVRGDGCHATLDTNAGVRVLRGFLDLWTPATLLVDAGITVAATSTCQAITAYTGTGMDGTVLNATVLNANVQYAVDTTTARTASEASAAYYDDRRGKGYSVTDGLGPLTSAWRTAAQQTTTITSIPSDATTTAYSDSGTNTGVGTSSGNTTFGTVVDFVNAMGTNASTEPGKRFYKYARPWRWSSSVVVVPTLVPAKGTTAATDGGYPSGHTAEAVRDALAMAYAVPERFQEMVARALELGRNRIVAGMHSPLDVVGGRILGQASAVANLYAMTADTRAAAYTQAHSVLMSAASASDLSSFYTYAHSGTDDRFSDTDTVKATAQQRLTFGFSTIADTTKTAQVPKGAELLLETRQPYLSAAQRRVVLKTTALSSGYPAMDDAEGYGRLNLVAAADGYGAFNGDVSVVMDGSLGGFNALDSWKNDISGAGLLTKSGTGTLRLTGANTYSGGTLLRAGTLVAASSSAFGSGVVYASGGTVKLAQSGTLQVSGPVTLLANSTLQMVLGSDSQGRLAATGTVTLDNPALVVSFASGYTPSVGDTLVLVTAPSVAGQFQSITVDGFRADVAYSGGKVLLTITE